MNELTSALKAMNRQSIPGCDGLTTDFYIVFWNQLGRKLLNAIIFSHEQGELYKSGLKGIITLLPKKQRDSRKLKNARPITVLCTCYKLIEKVLANRIKPLLEKLIHEDQKGFMKGRRISGNIRCILDIMFELERHKQEGLVISIDFCKCFDKIEKVAITGALTYFNFGQGIHKWIDILYTNSTSKVINNGLFSPPISIERSVKQGGPLSPYLFLLIAEVLAIELRKNSHITGCYVGEIKKLFGQYADDMDLYCKNNKTNIEYIDSIMTNFCHQTGCSINYEKTTIYRVGKYNEAVSQVYTIKDMRVETEGINVLGIDIEQDSEKMVQRNYDVLIKKANSVLMSWGNRQLSLYGKIVVVNTLVASLFVYRMYILPRISPVIVKKLEKLIENFIWNGRRLKINEKNFRIVKQVED